MSQKEEEKSIPVAEVPKEKEKGLTNIVSMSGLKSLLSKAEPEEKPVEQTDANLDHEKKEHEVHIEQSKSVSSVLSMSGLKSLLTKGGIEVKPSEDTNEIVPAELAGDNNKVMKDKVEEKTPHGPSLSVAGLKSLLKGHPEDEVKKGETVEFCIQASETVSVSVVKQDGEVETKVSDSEPQGKVYHL